MVALKLYVIAATAYIIYEMLLPFAAYAVAHMAH
jgi:hypothetical protein